MDRSKPILTKEYDQYPAPSRHFDQYPAPSRQFDHIYVYIHTCMYMCTASETYVCIQVCVHMHKISPRREMAEM
jgi:hypothetical protein